MGSRLLPTQGGCLWTPEGFINALSTQVGHWLGWHGVSEPRVLVRVSLLHHRGGGRAGVCLLVETMTLRPTV